MLTEMDGGYDVGYSSVIGFWGTAPSTLVVQYLASNSVVDLKVLDVGAGEGKNAAAFAKAGAHVDAVECSRVAINNAEKLHPGVPIRWTHADIKAFNLHVAYYDVIICYGLIHCLVSEREASETLARLKQALKLDGTLILCAFNDGSHDLSAHPGFHPLLLPHSWYVDQFADWRVTALTDSVLFETHPHNGIPHHHSLTRLMAVKI